MDIQKAIKLIEQKVQTPHEGLPYELFLFATRITPIVNVDLLIKDENGRILLSWRDDPFTGTGWHIPGGIVRFKETFENRIRKVAEIEIGAEVKFNPEPIAINQVIREDLSSRAHFISFLYKCFLSEKVVLSNTGLTPETAGYLQWHEQCPFNLIKYQNFYKKYIVK